jgi:RNA polymerase sigma factor (sigma-70 family)
MTGRTTRVSLLKRLQDPQDDAAWREFDTRYRGLILGYCKSRGLHNWDCEDIYQVVMMNIARVFQNGFRYSPEAGRFRGYLGCVLRNAIGSFLAKGDRKLIKIELDISPEAFDETDELWEEEWRRHHLTLAMERFHREGGARQQQVLEGLLRGERAQQIAQSLNMSEAAVHKASQRVRSQLRDYVKLQIREEDNL